MNNELEKLQKEVSEMEISKLVELKLSMLKNFKTFTNNLGQIVVDYSTQKNWIEEKAKLCKISFKEFVEIIEVEISEREKKEVSEIKEGE